MIQFMVYFPYEHHFPTGWEIIRVHFVCNCLKNNSQK